MSLLNQFPAGAKLLAAKLNETLPVQVRYEQHTLQTFVSPTDAKVKYETAIQTNSDVVASGTGNTDFGLQRVGLWMVTAALRYLGVAGGLERHIYVQTGSVFDVTQRIAQQAAPNVGAAPCTVTCSTTFRIAAVTNVFVAGFQNSGSNINTDVAFGGTNHVTLTWLGP